MLNLSDSKRKARKDLSALLADGCTYKQLHGSILGDGQNLVAVLSHSYRGCQISLQQNVIGSCHSPGKFKYTSWENEPFDRAWKGADGQMVDGTLPNDKRQKANKQDDVQVHFKAPHCPKSS